MKAEELIKRLNTFNDSGISKDDEVLIGINGREYRLKDVNIREELILVQATEYKMYNGIITSNPTHEKLKKWHYVLTADVPPSGKAIDIHKVDENIRKRIMDEYCRANSLIESAAFGSGDINGQITLIDVNVATEALIGFIKDELLR